MQIKAKDHDYVFEANDEAAKELLARGDYEEAGKSELTDEAIVEIARKPARKKRAK